MLPLIFVTNRVNYYRWMPVHILDMLSLPPEVVMHAPKDIEASLTKAFDNGATMAKSFVSDTLSEGQNGNFFGSISRSKLIAFEDLTKTTKLKCRSGGVVEAHINPELVFRRALVLASSREDVTVDKVMSFHSFPIGPISTSLFHDDGSMRKT